MKKYRSFWLLAIILSLSNNIFSQDESEPEAALVTEYKDHPLFNSMPKYFISSLEEKEFDSFIFPVESSTYDNRELKTVEGKFFDYTYQITEGEKEASPLQIFRNYENAITKAGGKIIAKVIEDGNSYSFVTGMFSKNKREVWVYIEASGYDYRLVIIEKEEMVQVIKANEMLDALSKDGFIALNILFETGKATIQAESKPLIDQVFELLKTNPDLKVSIEGHTDNTGTAAGNRKLSEDRAKSVVAALIALGINKERLTAAGWGQEKPVADNRTEEGRAKNRRVEIVKK
ncbi:MAG: membrane protein [Ignavibacteriaceae bacterium]|nr:MAG: OmpA family protein [Chlorobiota bacterium]GJQ31662.1 MAG: membrane protein [Ignavibacteriaceae bacterium]